MERILMDDLLNWKNDPYRKPLVLSGARQVGKTWLLKEFGSLYFENVAYINFEDDKRLLALFEDSLDPKRILHGISAITHEAIKPGETLIFIDEIQYCPRALTSLKYFCENAREYHVACAGSLLGLTLRQEGASYPVGKVDTMTLYPLNFIEFLLACDEGALADIASGKDDALYDVFAQDLELRLRQYYYVGGLPEVVERFTKTNDYAAVRKTQNDIINGYLRDIGKHLNVYDAEKVSAVWRAIPSQLAKEHKKFQYSGISSNARAREYAAGITWLQDAGIVYAIPRVSEVELPLDGHRDNNSFKLFVLDIGLLAAMTGLDSADIILGNELFARFKGAFTEQYVCQQLISGNGLSPYYWSRNSPKAEVDFLVEKKGSIYAIEAKAERNLRSKSLQALGKMKPYYHLLRTSMSKPAVHGCITEIPLYSLQNEALWIDSPTSRELFENARKKA